MLPPCLLCQTAPTWLSPTHPTAGSHPSGEQGITGLGHRQLCRAGILILSPRTTCFSQPLRQPSQAGTVLGSSTSRRTSVVILSLALSSARDCHSPRAVPRRQKAAPGTLLPASSRRQSLAPGFWSGTLAKFCLRCRTEVWTIPEDGSSYRSALIQILTAHPLRWQPFHAPSTPGVPVVGSAQHHSPAPLEPGGAFGLTPGLTARR